MKHALTMTMGTEWKEGVRFAWDDPDNDERQMEVAADRYRYILGRPIVAAPGERWNDNGGATAVIATLVSRGTDQPLLDFARERLFGPLAITEVEWITDHTGEPIAAWGVRFRPRDLAKIGQLVLQHGRWGEQQVLPAGWIEEATAAQAQATDPLLRYGYQWWLGNSNFGDAQTPWVAGFGRGGQRVFILPELELVVVVTAGNYDDPEQWRLPNAILNMYKQARIRTVPRVARRGDRRAGSSLVADVRVPSRPNATWGRVARRIASDSAKIREAGAPLVVNSDINSNS